MTNKAIYKHKKTGDVFAIEMDDKANGFTGFMYIIFGIVDLILGLMMRKN
jgi:hypothetical protein